MALPTAAYRWRGLWVNGDDYYNYDVAASPLSTLTYVLDNGNQLIPSVTDPSLDPNWKVLNPVAPVPPGLFSPSYGEFVSNTTQLLPATVQTPITFDAKNSGTADVTLSSPTTIRVNTSGIYRVIYSAQLEKLGGGGTDEIQMWFAVNGLNAPNTNSKVDISQQTNLVMTVESFFPLLAGNTVGLVGFTPVGSVQCAVVAIPVNANHPVSVPSVIVNIQRIA